MSAPPFSARKRRIHARAQSFARERARWLAKASFFRAEDLRYLRFLVPEGARVIELGCGTGDLLSGLRPGRGVGVDFSPAMIEQARTRHPGMEFHVADLEDPAWASGVEGPFDYLLMIDTIGSLDDCQRAFEVLQPLCDQHSRIIVAYYANFWEPLLKFAERVGRKMPTDSHNVLSAADIGGLLNLAGLEVIRHDWRQLLPVSLWGAGRFVNRYAGTLPGIRRLCLRNYTIARLPGRTADRPPSVSIVIPCRNERGSLAAAVECLPRFAPDMEVLFVEGHSADGTYEEALRVRAAYAGRLDIKVLRQGGRGKADAVYKGFDQARGDALMILDADLPVPPEALPKFYNALTQGRGEFINGSRMVHPMEDDAMRYLNYLANRGFSWLFTWLLNQRVTDTLCGTKVLMRRHYQAIRQRRGSLGISDPFGDFELILGAARLNLKILEIPVKYRARVYGSTQIARFRNGLMLARRVALAFLKMKAF